MKLFGFIVRSPKWIAATRLIVLLAAACDRPETGTGRLENMRCATDGVCWQQIGKRSIEGAYRKGDHEMKFDAVFTPSRAIMTQFADEWSFRLVDRRGIPFFTAMSTNPPDSWLDESKAQDRLPTDIDEQMTYLQERNNFAYEMAHAVIRQSAPAGQLNKPWKILCRYLQEQIINSRDELAFKEQHGQPQDTPDAEPSQTTVTHSEESNGNAFSGEDLLDDAETHADFAEGIAMEDDQGPKQPEETKAKAPASAAPLSTFAFGHAKNKRTNPTTYGEDPQSEFQQDLDLYWQHTRSFLLFGWKTGKHHTAACISLKKRPLGSSGPWAEVGRKCTENHGSKAGEGDMKLYTQCRNLPITQGWYAWKGECGGNYPTHFCNDDTALQIRHAHGLYDDGQKCLKRKRTHRPWCNRPW